MVVFFSNSYHSGTYGLLLGANMVPYFRPYIICVPPLHGPRGSMGCTRVVTYDACSLVPQFHQNVSPMFKYGFVFFANHHLHHLSHHFGSTQPGPHCDDGIAMVNLQNMNKPSQYHRYKHIFAKFMSFVDDITYGENQEFTVEQLGQILLLDVYHYLCI